MHVPLVVLASLVKGACVTRLLGRPRDALVGQLPSHLNSTGPRLLQLALCVLSRGLGTAEGTFDMRQLGEKRASCHDLATSAGIALLLRLL